MASWYTMGFGRALTYRLYQKPLPLSPGEVRDAPIHPHYRITEGEEASTGSPKISSPTFSKFPRAKHEF